MKKKFFTLFLTLLAALALASSASADLIWEPDDPFYESHKGECTFVNRSYQLEGYDGTVTIFTAPNGMSKVTLENGIRAYVHSIWTGSGTTWGYLSWLDGSDAEGWVPMDDLSLIYDSKQFVEDHKAEIQELEEVPVDFQEAVLYSYPNGPLKGYTLEEDPDYLLFSQAFDKLYTDENGLRWGHISYYFGHEDGWACLDGPMNEGLDTSIVPVAPSAAQTRGSVTVSPGLPVLPSAIGLVAAVVAATVVLIRRKKRNSPDLRCAAYLRVKNSVT